MQFSQNKFNAGYSDVKEPALLEDNELYTATNIAWDNQLAKRCGFERSINPVASANIVGYIRTKISGSYVFIFAIDDNSDVKIYKSGTPYTQIGTKALTKGYSVEMVEFQGAIIGVNGYDKPFIIKYTSGNFTISDLEAEQVKQRLVTEWGASKYVPTTWSDDTTAAQSGSAWTMLGGGVTEVVIGCDFTFNKIVLTSYTPSSVTNGAVYYWGSSGWTSLTLTTTPTWTTGGTYTMEFTIPNSSGTMLWSVMDTTIPEREGQYCIKIVLTGTSATAIIVASGTSKIYNTQYLSQITQWENAEHICVYKHSLFLSANNIINWSDANSYSSWDDYNVEIFPEGGSTIVAMCPSEERLIVFKNKCIYAMTGNQFATYYVSRLSSFGTIVQPYSYNNNIFFADLEGIKVLTGNTVVNISKHVNIASSITFISMREQLIYCISSSDGFCYVFDPDTFTMNQENGEGRVAIYKYTNYGFTYLFQTNGAGDTNYFYGIKGEHVYKLNTTKYYDAESLSTQNNTPVSIAVVFLSKRYTFTDGLQKLFGRLKVLTSAPCLYTLATFGNNGVESDTMTITSTSQFKGYLTSEPATGVSGDFYYNLTTTKWRIYTTAWGDYASFPTATRYWAEMLMRYTMDGNELMIGIAHTDYCAFNILTITLEPQKRRY